MELNILERLLLLNALPEKGNLTTIRIVRTLREELSFTEGEIADSSIVVHAGGQTTWDEKSPPKEVQIGATARGIVVDALGALSEAGNVTAQHITLFDKFDIEG